MEIRIPDLPDENLFAAPPAVFGHARSNSGNSFPSSQLHIPQPNHSFSINKSSTTSRTNRPPSLNSSVPPVQSHEAPIELALYVLLDDFFARADAKMNHVLSKDTSSLVHSFVGQGVDPAFDASLNCLANVGRRLPKLAVDLILRWRKTHTNSNKGNPERRSLASIHILCRALIAIVSVLDTTILQGELGTKLEDIVFNSFKNAQPYHVNRSLDRRANIRLYARLLSLLARARFESVSERFISFLEPLDKNLINREQTNVIAFRVRAIAHLPIITYPIEVFELAAGFVDSLAKIFESASGAPLKIALTEAICSLLVQVARNATAEVNHPTWTKAVELIFQRSQTMAAKPRYAAPVLPLLATALASAPQELLLSRWQTAIDHCMARVRDKDKTIRLTAAHSLMLLLHAYLRRAHEPPAATQRRLEPLVKTLTPLSSSPSASSPSAPSSSATAPLTSAVRRAVPPQNYPELIDINAAIAVPHLITLRHFTHGSELITSLMSLPSHIPKSEDDLYSSFYPTRFVTGLYALLSTLDSLEFRRGDPIMPRPSFLPMDIAWEDDDVRKTSPDASKFICGLLSDDTLQRQGVAALVSDSQRAVLRVLQVIDRSLGPHSDMFDERNLVSRIPDPVSPNNAPPSDPSQPSLDTHSFKVNGSFTVCYPKSKQPYFDILALCFDSWPRLLILTDNDTDLLTSTSTLSSSAASNGNNANNNNSNNNGTNGNNNANISANELEAVLNILLRSITHVDPAVANAAREAISRLVSIEHCPHVLLAFRLTKYLTRNIASPSYILFDNATYQTAATSEVDKLVQFWSDTFASFSTLLLTPSSHINSKLPTSQEADSTSATAASAALASQQQKRNKGGLAPGFVFGGDSAGFNNTSSPASTSTENMNPEGVNNHGGDNNGLNNSTNSDTFAGNRPKLVAETFDRETLQEILHLAQATSLVLLCYQSAGARKGALSVLFHVDLILQRCSNFLQLENGICSVIRAIGSFHDALDRIAQEDLQYTNGIHMGARAFQNQKTNSSNNNVSNGNGNIKTSQDRAPMQTQLISHLNGAERARLNMYRKPSLSKRNASLSASYNPKDDDIGWRMNHSSFHYDATASPGNQSVSSSSQTSSPSISLLTTSNGDTKANGPNRELLDLIRSDNLADHSLWQRLLPWTFRRILDELPDVAKTARYILERAVNRLYHPATLLAGISPQTRSGPISAASARPQQQATQSVPDALVLSEHWRSHITALCGLSDEVVPVSTLTLDDGSPLRPVASTDSNIQYAPLNRGMDELFSLIIPFLGSENPLLREAVIAGFAAIHPNLYPALMEHLNVSMRQLADERSNLLREREISMRSSSAQPGLSRKITKFSRIHASISRVLDFTSSLLTQQQVTMPHRQQQLPPPPVSTLYTTHMHLFAYIRDSFGFLRDYTHPNQQSESTSIVPPLFDDTTLTAWKRSFCNNLTAFIISISSKQKVNASPENGEIGPLVEWLPNDFTQSVFNVLDQWCFRAVSPASASPLMHQSNSPSESGGRRSLSHSRPYRKPSASHHPRGQSTSSMSSVSNMQNLAFEIFLPAARTMATLCEYHSIVISSSGTPNPSEPGIEIHDILRWAQILLESNRPSAHECAGRGLRNLITSNKNHTAFLDALVSQSFAEPDSLTLPQTTFAVLSPFLVTKQINSISIPTKLALALWKLTHPDIGTRQRALDLLAATLSDEASFSTSNHQSIHAAYSVLHSTYAGVTATQHKRLSSIIATCFPTHARQVVSDLTSRLVQLGGRHSKQLLQLLPRWLSLIELFPSGISSDTPDPIAINLFLLTAKYGDISYNEIVECWKIAVRSTASAKLLLDWLAAETCRRGSREFIRHAQRVVLAITEPELGFIETVFEHLCSLIVPSSMVATTESSANLENHDMESVMNVSGARQQPGPRKTTLDKAFQVLSRRSMLTNAQAALFLSLEAFIARLGLLLSPSGSNNSGDGLKLSRSSTSDAPTTATVATTLHGLLLHVDHHISLVRHLSREGLLRLLYLARHLSSWEQLGSSNDPSKFFNHDLMDAFVALQSGNGGDQHVSSHPSLSSLSTAALPMGIEERLPTRWAGFWEHDEPSPLKSSRTSGRAPTCMKPLVDDSIAFFQQLAPELAAEWVKVALSWAISCPIRHMACRSFQAIRLLKTLPDDQRALAEMTMRLSNTISDKTPDSQLFAREILFTLSDVVQASDLEDMMIAPQLLWTLVASLESNNKLEFLEAVSALSKVLQNLDRAGQHPQYSALCQSLEAHRPQNLCEPNRFLSYVQLCGLRCNTTDVTTWAFIRTLASSYSASSILADPSSILICTYAAGLPWCLNALEASANGRTNCDEGEVEKFAADVAKLADMDNKPGISRVMTSMSRGKFRSKDDFIRHSIANIKEYYSEADQLQFFIYLLGLLLNPRLWIRSRVLSLLKAFLRVVNLEESTLTSALGGDLLSPLLRLLSTDLAQDALLVLEEQFPSIPIVSDQLQSSSTSRPGTSSSSGASRSRSRHPTGGSGTPGGEENVTETLTFGDVEADGWCTPVPQQGETITRKSLGEILETFANQSAAHPSSPPVEFTNDEYPFPPLQSAELKVQQGSMEDEDPGDPSSSLGDLVSQLHDLGDFFEKDSIQGSSAFRMSQMIGSASRVAAVLSRSLRNPSSSSSPHETSTRSSSLQYRNNGRAIGGGIAGVGVSSNGRVGSSGGGGGGSSSSSSGENVTDISGLSSEAINTGTLATVDEFDIESSSIETEWADDESHSTPSLHSTLHQPPSPVHFDQYQPRPSQDSQTRPYPQRTGSDSGPTLTSPGLSEPQSHYQQLYRAVRNLSPGRTTLWHDAVDGGSDLDETAESGSALSTSEQAATPSSPSATSPFKPLFFGRKKIRDSREESSLRPNH